MPSVPVLPRGSRSCSVGLFSGPDPSIVSALGMCGWFSYRGGVKSRGPTPALHADVFGDSSGLGIRSKSLADDV